MTKFTSLENREVKVKTKFTHAIVNKKVIEVTEARPSDYDNVLHIGKDEEYGDVFKCWNDKWETTFVLLFGVKGNEFD